MSETIVEARKVYKEFVDMGIFENDQELIGGLCRTISQLREEILKVTEQRLADVKEHRRDVEEANKKLNAVIQMMDFGDNAC